VNVNRIAIAMEEEKIISEGEARSESEKCPLSKETNVGVFSFLLSRWLSEIVRGFRSESGDGDSNLRKMVSFFDTVRVGRSVMTDGHRA
jgi:hypothetical protein